MLEAPIFAVASSHCLSCTRSWAVSTLSKVPKPNNLLCSSMFRGMSRADLEPFSAIPRRCLEPVRGTGAEAEIHSGVKVDEELGRTDRRLQSNLITVYRAT